MAGRMQPSASLKRSGSGLSEQVLVHARLATIADWPAPKPRRRLKMRVSAGRAAHRTPPPAASRAGQPALRGGVKTGHVLLLCFTRATPGARYLLLFVKGRPGRAKPHICFGTLHQAGPCGTTARDKSGNIRFCKHWVASVATSAFAITECKYHDLRRCPTMKRASGAYVPRALPGLRQRRHGHVPDQRRGRAVRRT
eukprot:gene8171-biopygen6108